MPLRCQNEYPVCSYKYNQEQGDPEDGIVPGTLLEEIPAGWVCLKCCRVEEKEQVKGEGGNHG